MRTFIIADSSADPWSAFHRDAAAKRDSWNKLKDRILYGPPIKAPTLQRELWSQTYLLDRDMGDEEAEELVRRYRANYGRK